MRRIWMVIGVLACSSCSADDDPASKEGNVSAKGDRGDDDDGTGQDDGTGDDDATGASDDDTSDDDGTGDDDTTGASDDDTSDDDTPSPRPRPARPGADDDAPEPEGTPDPSTPGSEPLSPAEPDAAPEPGVEPEPALTAEPESKTPVVGETPGPEGGNLEGGCAIPNEARLEDTSSPDHVIGDGSAASCTGQAVVDGVARGGIITFDCGSDPVTITLTEPAKVVNDTGPKIVIDGGGLVTLSGGGTTRILYMNTCDENQNWTTSHCQDQDHPQLTVQNLTFVDADS
jgi:hypothetical protein